jgi:hydroxypyruvate isomerase
MERRNFIRNSMAAAGTALVSSAIGAPVVMSMTPAKKYLMVEKHNFNLHYAPHFGMFENLAGKDLLDQLKFMADTGFTAMEDNGMMGREVSTQEKIASQMSRLGMKMGVFVIDGGDNWKVSLATGKPEFKETFINACKKAVEVAARCNATWMTVVPGYFDRTRDLNHQTASVIDALRAGAEIFEPHNLVMVLEPLSDNPDLFLRFSPQSYMICKAVNSPSCKILFDIYHMQRNEGDLIMHMDKSWDEIAYIQTGDNPGRKEPTTGEINYRNVFKFIYEKGYQGILGMEHGLSQPGKGGEQALIDAYAEVDKFK